MPGIVEEHIDATVLVAHARAGITTTSSSTDGSAAMSLTKALHRRRV
jgi:hypothetical protein